LRFTISSKTQDLVCARTGRVGQAQRDTTTPPKPLSEHEASTEQASRTNVSGRCEVIAKCERTFKLPPDAERERLEARQLFRLKWVCANMVFHRNIVKIKKKDKSVKI
jgi:hypothetical protein